MAGLIYGSSLTDPRYANFGGGGLQPISSNTNPLAANYSGRLSQPSALIPNVKTDSTLGWMDSNTGGGTTTTKAGTGVTQDNLISGAVGDNNALLSSLNTQFDQNAEALRNQSATLDNQFNDTQKFYSDQQSKLSGVVDTSINAAKDAAANNQADALSTAQDVQRQNRNMLRALGILASSAGGDILSRPMGEYEKVRGQIATQLINRSNELYDFLNQKTSELIYAAKQARSQYDSLKQQIASDLRFNDRQRSDAINQASQALVSRINDIRVALNGYSQQTAAEQTKIANWVNTVAKSNPGDINTTPIASATMAPLSSTGGSSVTASIYDPNRKNLLSSLG